jgi:hypothetical protein
MDAITRNLVRLRAGRCCEYCQLPELGDPYTVFHIEHIIAKQHGGDDDPANLAWSCSRCNHRKGTNLSSRDPNTGTIVELFHPRQQAWGEHFAIRDARIIGSSPTGRATVRLLDMNEGRRVRLRRELIEQGEFPIS